MPIFDRYILRQLVVAVLVVSLTLATIIFLTQSLRFLEMVLNAGAPASIFWILTLLALPRFFEVILPLALMMAILFVYNRMTMDSEITVVRALGAPPLALARPALFLAGVLTMILWTVTMWLAPVSLSNMQHMRQAVLAEYSTMFFREGIFSNIRPGLTVFIRERAADGELRGVMIHDRRSNPDNPVTITARRGRVAGTEQGQQVVVYEGTRQDINQNTGALNRLAFERYTIDIPDDRGTVSQRWRQPYERTLFELFNPDPENERDMESKRDFMVDVHRRIVSPLLVPSFALMALAVLLMGPLSRGGQGRRIALAVFLAILIQGLYLGSFNLARQSDVGLLIMYGLVFAPILTGVTALSRYGENLRRRWLFSSGRASP